MYELCVGTSGDVYLSHDAAGERSALREGPKADIEVYVKVEWH